MPRLVPLRSHYTPADAVEDSAAESSAVAYRYSVTRGGVSKLAAIMFSGKRQKPDSHYIYGTEEKRDAAIQQHREGVHATEARKIERRAAVTASRSKTAALDFTGKDYLSASDCAALARKSLAESFPGHKFSVRVSHTSVQVDWFDGPTGAQVESIAGQVNGSYFDGMIDYKGSIHHELDGRRVRFGADFVFCSRTMTTAALLVGAAAFEASRWGETGVVSVTPPAHDGYSPTVTLHREGRGTVKSLTWHELELIGPDERFHRPEVALQKWFDSVQPVTVSPSPTFARFHILGSDGYGQSGYEPADGGRGARGYAPFERDAMDAAKAAAAPTQHTPAAKITAADSLASEEVGDRAAALFAGFLTTWQPSGLSH